MKKKDKLEDIDVEEWITLKYILRNMIEWCRLVSSGLG
jgi:hypothetical protein